MIESIIQTKVNPQAVWQAWQKAHAMSADFVPGKKGSLKTGRSSQFHYQILSVREGESFSILWKSLFVRLLFTQEVTPHTERGSQIRYSVNISGFFAWPARFFLKNKIQRNLSLVLHSLVKELER